MILSELFEMYQSQRTYAERDQINANAAELKKDFSIEQRKLLLRIHDDYGLIIEAASEDNFAAGFRLAAKLMFEIFVPQEEEEV